MLCYMYAAQETGGTKPRETDHLKFTIHGEKITVLSWHEPYNYLAKPTTVAENIQVK